MSLQRLSSRREEQVGQKREWCSVAMGQAGGGGPAAASEAEIGGISRCYRKRDFFKVLWFKPRIEEGTVDT